MGWRKCGLIKTLFKRTKETFFIMKKNAHASKNIFDINNLLLTFRYW